MKPIPNYPHYSITKDGRIFSYVGAGRKVGIKHKPLKKPRELKNTLDKGTGYYVVSLGAHNKKFVHRLVLETYVGPANGQQCRHLNGNKLDNRIENLCWGTYEENLEDRHKLQEFRAPGIGESHYRTNLTNEDIYEIRRLAKDSNMTQKEIGKIFNIGQNTVSRIIHRVRWKHI